MQRLGDPLHNIVQAFHHTQVGADGEGHPGQARFQGQVGRARVSGGQRRAHWIERDIETLLLLRIPHKNPPSGTKEWQVFVATGSIYGTRDAGRGWYEHSKKVLEPAGFVESKLQQGLYDLPRPSGPEAVGHTHVDDFLIAFRKASKAHRDVLEHLVHMLHLKQQTGAVVYCGRTTSKDGSHIKVNQAKTTVGLECMSIDLGRRTLESALTNAEITAHRIVLGHADWLGQQSQPDLCVGVSLAAQTEPRDE